MNAAFYLNSTRIGGLGVTTTPGVSAVALALDAGFQQWRINDSRKGRREIPDHMTGCRRRDYPRTH